MNRNYYIFKSGTLQRKDNNIRVVTEDKIKKDIPCETVSDLYLFGEINMNTKLLNFLAQKKILSRNSISVRLFRGESIIVGPFSWIRAG